MLLINDLGASSIFAKKVSGLQMEIFMTLFVIIFLSKYKEPLFIENYPNHLQDKLFYFIAFWNYIFIIPIY